ncbi:MULTISPECIES: hypothetical protein [unclassified Delftia]|uniref:hypothetical protein n=1 Tax=unclassified Delftia TaxID=2613839 RepID=UPI00190232BE|nr:MULTISPECIES: hypothetical protein [unclassified Delftia]MBK0115901.1 hypothetical protein [Delftia sp. S65]MBK0121798.1 hypothetical protein [Delftia sp. S67]MBK0133371.1 hypothetical protein [Delftia sp. S66]
MAALNPQSWAVRVTAAALPYVLLGVACAAAGATGGWHLTGQAWQARYDREALSRLEAQRLADKAADFKRQAERATADKAAGEHAKTLETLNNQLGGAHAQIALLSRRQCLDAHTVRMLNDIGAAVPHADDMRAVAGDSASEAPTSSPAAHDAAGYASERDVAESLAVCRASYYELESQLNKILDIEDARTE